MAFNLRKPPKLVAKKQAYSYQLDAFRAVQDLPYAAIFHEQGLGKTKIAIDLALYWLEKDIVDTVFIITKKALVQNWTNEIKMHSHVTPGKLSDNRKENSIALNSPVLLYILNYEVITSNFELINYFLDTCRVAVILDESHKIKNPDSKLAVDFHKIAGKFAKKVIMTGTPVANRPFDIWSQIMFLDGGKTLGTSFSEFKKNAELPKASQVGKEYAEFLSNIFEKIESFVVRETKDTAGIELPNKTILTHFVDLEERQRKIYQAYKERLSHEIQEEFGLKTDNAEDILKRLLRLVQCASNPNLVDSSYDALPGKFSFLCSLLHDILEDEEENSNIIVWTSFIQNVEWLKTQLKKYSPVIVHGKMKIEDRNQSIEQFKNNHEVKILIATPGSAKEGLTLTNANHAVFYDRSFSLDDYLQAQDRIHRISQEKECYVHNLIAVNTIDEWVDSLLNAKYLAAQVTQGDIDGEQFEENYTFDLANALSEVIGT